MASLSDPRRLTMVATAAAAVVGGAWLLSRYFRPSSSENADGQPTMSEEEVVEVFQKILRAMNQIMARLMQNIKAIQAQIPDPAQLQQIILMEFEKQLTKCQEQVFAEHNADEEDVEESTSFYLRQGSESVKREVEKLKKMYTDFGGRVEMEAPADLTVDKMCEVLEDYLTAYQHANDIAMAEVKKSGGQITEAIQAKLRTMAETITGEALSKHGMDTMTFQAGCQKFQKDPKFMKKAAEMEAKAQMRQQMAAQAFP